MQVVNNNGYWDLRCVDEIALVNPRNSTEEVCEEFIERYDNHKPQVYFIMGMLQDIQASNGSKTDFAHHYEMIDINLRKYLVNGSDRTLLVNPSFYFEGTL